jgi:hypothetical protein
METACVTLHYEEHQGKQEKAEFKSGCISIYEGDEFILLSSHCHGL